MKHRAQVPFFSYVVLSMAIVMIVIGAVVLANSFAHYNELSLARQDSQLVGMAQAADESMAAQLSIYRRDLGYVLGRRGFTEAENLWRLTGDSQALLSRMQENLIAQNPLIHALLVIQDGQVVLSSAQDGTDYYFPTGMEGSLQPCFGSDTAMYLALIEETSSARYAALLDMSRWYEELTRVYANNSTRLLLLGGQRKVLLHQWMNQNRVSAVEELTLDNCDAQAVRLMITSHNSGKPLTDSYRLQLPGDSFIHEMRMTVIPDTECQNGYFVVGLTSDYDEITQPMHAVAIRLVICGGMVIAGVVLLILMVIRLARLNRHHNRQLQELSRLNEETQHLLEKTKELAHHQRLETIGTLTASIAHEFNNLLTPIMGYAILTLEGLPENCDDLADNITEIYDASRKAKDIISRLNALSRRNAEERFRPLSLHDLATKALTVAKPAQPAHVTTIIENKAEVCFVSGIETQLSQLLLNLILNAYHAMEETGGNLTLTIARDGDDALLQVKDTGTGIAPEVLPHIFEPFFTTKETGRGTGLGLAIAQQVAQSHHGAIQVESLPGQGATFTLRLPLANEPETADS